MKRMVVTIKNIFESIMNLLFRSTGSAHVRLSEKANNIFKDSQRGDNIIKAISEHKKDISEGRSVVVATNDKEYGTLSVERVSDKR